MVPDLDTSFLWHRPSNYCRLAFSPQKQINTSIIQDQTTTRTPSSSMENFGISPFIHMVNNVAPAPTQKNKTA
jgi:peptide subunit release factor RF-3